MMGSRYRTAISVKGRGWGIKGIRSDLGGISKKGNPRLADGHPQAPRNGFADLYHGNLPSRDCMNEYTFPLLKRWLTEYC